jgi:hypothetical protein
MSMTSWTSSHSRRALVSLQLLAVSSGARASPVSGCTCSPTAFRTEREAAFVEVDDDVDARLVRVAGYEMVVVVAALPTAGFGTERRRRLFRYRTADGTSVPAT